MFIFFFAFLVCFSASFFIFLAWFFASFSTFFVVCLGWVIASTVFSVVFWISFVSTLTSTSAFKPKIAAALPSIPTSITPLSNFACASPDTPIWAPALTPTDVSVLTGPKFALALASEPAAYPVDASKDAAAPCFPISVLTSAEVHSLA